MALSSKKQRMKKNVAARQGRNSTSSFREKPKGQRISHEPWYEPFPFEAETFVTDVEIAQPCWALGTPTPGVSPAASLPVVSRKSNSDLGAPTPGISAAAFIPVPASESSNDDDDDLLDLGTPTPGVAAAASLPTTSSNMSGYISPPSGNSPAKSNQRKQSAEASVKRPPVSTEPRRFNPKKRKQKPGKIDSCPDYPHFDDSDPEVVVHLIDQAIHIPKYADDFLNYGFCCANCKCSDDIKNQFLVNALESGHNTSVVQSETGGKAHRACCHRYQFPSREKKKKPRIVGPCENALECTQEEVNNGQVTDSEIHYDRATKQTIWKQNKSAESVEKALINYSKLAGNIFLYLAVLWQCRALRKTQLLSTLDFLSSDPATVLYSNQSYTERAKKFAALSKLINEGKIERRGLTLISCFSGIGSDVVALKRLGIKIDKGMQVEDWNDSFLPF